MNTQKENLQKIDTLDMNQIASVCDHTFLKRPESYVKDAKPGENPMELCEKAFIKFLEETVQLKTKPYSICVRPENVEFAKKYLETKDATDIKIASVVGFPDGTTHDTRFKVSETSHAIHFGATEIDMVLDYKRFKKGELNYVKEDIAEVLKVAHQKKVIVKLILETSELNHEQIQKACEMAQELGVDFVKTSTGFSPSGAKAEDLKIMKKYFSRGLKMSGGVNAGNVKELLKAASGREDGQIDLNPMNIRIGESSLIKGDPNSKY